MEIDAKIARCAWPTVRIVCRAWKYVSHQRTDNCLPRICPQVFRANDPGAVRMAKTPGDQLGYTQ